MENKEIVKIYLESKFNRNRLVEEFERVRLCDPRRIHKAVNTWIRHFRYRWKTAHGKARFFERHKDWLEKTCEVHFVRIDIICNIDVLIS